MGYVLIPQPDTFIEHLAEFASAFSPDEIDAPKMRELIGSTLLRDADIGAVDLGSPIVVLFDTPAQPMAAPEVHLLARFTDAAPFQALADKRELHWSEAEGVGILAASAPGERAEALRTFYHSAESEAPQRDGRLRIDLAQIEQHYGNALRSVGMMLSGTVAAQDPDLAPIAPLFHAAIVSLANILADSDGYQVDVDLDGERIAIDQIYVAAQDSALAALFATAPGDVQPALAMLPPREAAMRMAGVIDGDALQAWAADQLERLGEDAMLEPHLDAEMRQRILDWMGLADGAMASQVRFSDGVVQQEWANEVDDPRRALELIADLTSLFGADGPIGRIYRKHGIAIALERDVRRIGEIPVHRLGIEFLEGGDPEEKEIMQQTMQPNEFAFVDQWQLGGQARALDGMISRALGHEIPAPISLAARERFGPGAHSYLDYDLVRYFQGLATMIEQHMGENPFGAIAVEDAEPVSAAVFSAENRAAMQVFVPVAPIAAMFRQMQQRMRQRMGGGPPADQPF